MIGAANRDPARYPDPDRLDLMRTGPPTLAFGNGPHFCVGAGLARLEAQETFNCLARSALRPGAGRWSYSREHARTFRRLRSLHVADSRPPHPRLTLDSVPLRRQAALHTASAAGGLPMGDRRSRPPRTLAGVARGGPKVSKPARRGSRWRTRKSMQPPWYRPG